MKNKILAMLLAATTVVSSMFLGEITAFACEDAEIVLAESSVEEITPNIDEDIPDCNGEQLEESNAADLTEDAETLLSIPSETNVQSKVPEADISEESTSEHKPCPVISYENDVITVSDESGEIISKAQLSEDNGTYRALITDKNDEIVGDIRTVITDTDEEKSIESTDIISGNFAKLTIENRIPATCTEAGSFDQVAYFNGNEIYRMTIYTKPNGHKVDVVKYTVIKEPTCCSVGYRKVEKYCSCGELIEETIEEIPVIEPVPGEEVIEPDTPVTPQPSNSPSNDTGSQKTESSGGTNSLTATVAPVAIQPTTVSVQTRESDEVFVTKEVDKKSITIASADISSKKTEKNDSVDDEIVTTNEDISVDEPKDSTNISEKETVTIEPIPEEIVPEYISGTTFSDNLERIFEASLLILILILVILIIRRKRART